MLGSRAEAEDILQDAYLRWEAATDVREPRAFLTRVVTNLCLDHLKSARRQREEYVGTWLPEPISTVSPEVTALERESLRIAFLRLLQDLNPRERAAYLLREVFGHEYAELSAFLDESEDNCRQLASRAKRRLAEHRSRYQAAPGQLDELLASFRRAAEDGDLEPLMARLRHDVVVWSDGGGKASAAINPVHGADKVSRMMAGLMRKGFAARFEMAELNDEPAMLVYQGDVLDTAVIFQLGPDGLEALYIVRNPDKLEGLRS